jgi:hypothetical protein
MTNLTTPKKPYYKKSSAVKELEEMAFEAKKRKHPTVPYLSRDKFRDDTANGLTMCILKHIRLFGGQAERISTTGRLIDRSSIVSDVLGHRRKIGGLQYIPTTGTKGSADISATIKSLSVKIEVKIGKDRQSEAQKQYQNSIEKSGGFYCIAKDFASFLEWYTKTLGRTGNE